MLYDVFISYTQPNKNEAFFLHDMLQANDLNSWIDRSKSSGIAVTRPFEGEIVRAIVNSRVFLLVYSEFCNGSTEIIKEVRHRPSGQHTLILRLDHSGFGDDLSWYLKGLQYIDASHKDFRALFPVVLQQIRQLMTPDPATRNGVTTDYLLFEKGLQLFDRKIYPQAVAAFQQHLDIAPTDSLTRFYLVLSLIGGTKTRKLHGRTIAQLEQLLLPVLDSPEDGEGYIAVLLAIIRHGYYEYNGFLVPSPPVDQLMAGSSLGSEKLEILRTHLYEPENEVWLGL
ncbi:MAG TPA: toll/interleukin-1 receptor domain-containing protein [Puia sp.]|jgi:hypothetical protein